MGEISWGTLTPSRERREAAAIYSVGAVTVLGPGPKPKQYPHRKIIKLIYGCFDIRANFMEGTTRAKLIR